MRQSASSYRVSSVRLPGNRGNRSACDGGGIPRGGSGYLVDGRVNELYKRSMDDDVRRWNRVKEVFQDALERSVDDRGPFLIATCGDDGELKGEVTPSVVLIDELW
jgi:hypothetical protein